MPSRVRIPARPVVGDAVVAAAVAVLVGLGSWRAAALQQPPRPLDAWAFLMVAVPAGALAWRRSAPLVALVGSVEREREIVARVATGRSNDEIAAELFLSPATVCTHVGRAMLKLGARDRAQLVVFGIRAGLAIPGE